MTATVILAPPGSDLVQAAFALRHEVFVVEQGVPEAEELDDVDHEASTRHLVAVVSDEVVATVRWLQEPPGYADAEPSLGPIAHLQRLAVAASARRGGIGQLLVSAVEREAAEAGLRAVSLAAQTHAVPFYERSGYRAYGDAFDDAGIPHRHMIKVLDGSGTAARSR